MIDFTAALSVHELMIRRKRPHPLIDPTGVHLEWFYRSVSP